MLDFPIPHIPPIRFVESLISADAQSASVKIGFDTIPTLGMLIEAAAQSSSGIISDNSKTQMGVLVTLKNIKLLQELKATKYIVDIDLDYKLDAFKYFSFKVSDNNTIVATGSLSIALQ